MNLESLNFIRLTLEHEFKLFDCGDSDLNDFLLNDSKKFLASLLAVTYLIESDNETVAFFSLYNDRISYHDFPSGAQWNKFRKGVISSEKRLRSYPAVKIGRLAVNSTWKGKQIGTAILDYVKNWILDNNRTGCKFITVDAYDQSLKFYEKNEFKYLTEMDKGLDTRVMYFDLYKLV